MKIALLYTSYRQFRELDFMPEFFARTARLKVEADVLFHCNNAEISEASLQEKLAKVPAKSLLVRHSPQQNTGGYPYGQFEAIVDLWDHVDLAQWDWIVHLHPDIFIADERPLLAALESAERAGKDMIVSAPFGHNTPAFSTDFFAIKPLPKFKAIFESYVPLLKTPIVVPLENLFFIEVHRANANYVKSDRYAHGQYYRDIDRLGLWHEHHLQRVAAYLIRPGARWRTTAFYCLINPKHTIRATLIWLNRRRKGLPQDSLAKQLTRH